jgi:hypothetical protein
MIEILPPMGKYQYDTWSILLVKCYIDNFVRFQSCIRNINSALTNLCLLLHISAFRTWLALCFYVPTFATHIVSSPKRTLTKPPRTRVSLCLSRSGDEAPQPSTTQNQPPT